MNEQQIRAIVQDEILKNYRAGSPIIPPHSHNRTDGLQVNPVDLQGFQVLPKTGNGVLSPKNMGGNLLVGPNQDPSGVFVCPLPIIATDINGFSAGDAPTGTALVFDSVIFPNPILYIKTGDAPGEWSGVELIL